MPTYEYICGNCGYEFEQLQSITAKPLRKCPKCGKRCLKRLIGTGAGVIFKGSGFYETDYRSKSYKEAQKKEKDTSKEKKDERKTETAKAESKESKSSQRSDSTKKDEKKST